MPIQDHFRHEARHEARFTGPNQPNIRQSQRATQVFQQVLQSDQRSAALCFPWQCPPPKPSMKSMSAKAVAALERFNQRHTVYVEPLSRPSWQDQSQLQPIPMPAVSHRIKQPVQDRFHTRPSPVLSTTSHAGYRPATAARPAAQVSTAPAHGRSARFTSTHQPQYPATNSQMFPVLPGPPTERLAASAAKTRIHQILHRDGAKRASNGTGTGKLPRPKGSSLKRQLSVNNGDVREELVRLAGSRTGGTNSAVSRPSKRARKRAGK
ncbi:hypothetical protein QBC40DRAFT_19729 [Triangularia verruculosa]|uniref:Uncharacterized protein n=1 Tax=Triangularia verruculosa TaxID=2587418 RepID=A0AAN6XD06_9PEZI|nr:hypothetical protein QBC40DRAFT_19729 [Triangularia verruculosa]